MKKIKLYDCIIWVITLILISLIFTLPDTVPIHWDNNFKVDGYGNRNTFLILALLPISIYYGILFTKYIDPKKKNFEGREKIFKIFRNVLSGFFVVLALFFYYLILNPEADIQQLFIILIGIFMLGMGNYLPKVPQNYYIGIKTSWALSSPYVWKRTHKMGGYSFAIAGLLMIVLSFLQIENLMTWMLVIILISSGITVWYSYNVYQNKPKDID